METRPPDDTLPLPRQEPSPAVPPQAAAMPPAPPTTSDAPTEKMTAVVPAGEGAAPATPIVTPKRPALSQRQKLLAALGVLLIVLVVLVSAGIIIAQPARQARIATTPSATSQVPQATATPPPATPNPVTLGSPLQAFTKTFGDPATAYADSETFVATTHQIQTRIFVALAPGNDGAQHGQYIHVEPATGAWNLDTASALMLQFLPADARHQGDVAGPNGVSYHVYHSDALAQIFPATTFTTTARHAASAGSFSWFCATDLSFCYIGPIVPDTGNS